ncbi:GAF domain-containing protein [Myxococcaceae bacterium JPH2]|nr:GAF domain-containing protein [Myxococcaceae bacterium JPH2]
MEKRSFATVRPPSPAAEPGTRHELLAEAARQLVGVSPPAEVARRLSLVLAPRLVETCSVELLDTAWASNGPAVRHLARALQRLVLAGDAEPLGGRGPREGGPSLLESETGGRHTALLPLRCGGRTHGVVLLSGRGLDAAAVALAEEVVEVAARGLELAMRHEEERGARARAERASLRMESLQSLTFALAGARTPEDVASAVVEETVRTLEADAAGLFLVDAESTALELVHSMHFSPLKEAFYRRVPLDAALPIAESFRTNSPVWMEDLGAYALRYPDAAALGQVDHPGGMAVACIPLAAHGQPRGALCISFDHARAFDAEEQSFIVLMARQCAMALERARLLASERQQVERSELLQRATAALATSLDVEHALRAAAVTMLPTLGDFCFFDVLTVEGDMRRVSWASGPEAAHLLAASHWHPPEPRGTDLCAFTTGKPVLHPHVDAAFLAGSSSGAEQRALLSTLGSTSLVSVPLPSQEGTLGALTLGFSTSGRHHTEEDQALACELARRAATAVQNSHLFHQTQQAIQLRDEFLAIASHELNTPLTALKLHLARLQRVSKDADVQERTAAATQQADRLGKLVRELLDVSRLSAGRLQLHPETLDLVELCRETLSRFGDDLARMGSEVNLSAPGPLVGRWDRDRLHQVVAHLLANALKYGQGQPVDLELSTDVDDSVKLVVRDRGMGIPPEQQARLFRRFERAVPLRNYGGFGLGLWMVKQVVEAHGGLIRLDSAPGVGTTLTLELPRVCPET